MLTIQFFDVEIPRKLGHQSCVILTNFKTKDFHTFSHSLSLSQHPIVRDFVLRSKVYEKKTPVDFKILVFFS